MIERIEWVEPEEVAHERHEKSQQANLRVSRTALRCSLLVGVPAELTVVWLAPESALVTGAAVLYMAAVMALAYRTALRSKPVEATCNLDDKGAGTKPSLGYRECLWNQAHRFEIADHPTLPGIRRLTLRRKSGLGVHFSFRAGQLDEAELRAFVQARIAEQMAQRLMRRVKM